MQAEAKPDDTAQVHEPDDCPSSIYYSALFIIFVDMASMFFALPLMPLVAQDVGATTVQIGIIVGVLTFSMASGNVLWGTASDYVDRRLIINVNLVGLSLGYALTGLATSARWLIFSRALTGLCASTAPVVGAVVFDYSPTRYRARDMVNFYTAMNLAVCLSPAIAGLLDLYFSWRGVMFVAAAVPFANILCVNLFFLSDDAQRREANSNAQRNQVESDARESQGDPTSKGKAVSEANVSEDPLKLYLLWLRTERSACCVLACHFCGWLANGFIAASVVLVNTTYFNFTVFENLMTFTVGGTTCLLTSLASSWTNVRPVEDMGARSYLLIRAILGSGLTFSVICCTRVTGIYAFSHMAPYVYSFVGAALTLFQSPAAMDLLRNHPKKSTGVNIGAFNFLQLFGESVGMMLAGQAMSYNMLYPYWANIALTLFTVVFIPCTVPGELKGLKSE